MDAAQPESLLIKYECSAECNRRVRQTLTEGLVPEDVALLKSVRDDFHVTLLFARRWKRAPTGEPLSETRMYSVGKAKNMNGCALAMLLSVPDSTDPLLARHAEIVRTSGAEEDHPIYLPHVTVAYLKPDVCTRDEARLLASLERLLGGEPFEFDRERSKLMRL